MDDEAQARRDGWKSVAERDAYEADYWTEALTEAVTQGQITLWELYRDHVEKHQPEALPMPRLKIKAFAHLAGVSSDTIRRRRLMLEAGGYAEKVGGVWLFSREALEHLNDAPPNEQKTAPRKRRKTVAVKPDSEVW